MNIRELKKLNFHDLIDYDCDAESYSTEDYKKTNEDHNKRHHPAVNGYCTLCELTGCNMCPSDNTFHLQNISHGTHSIDFINYLNFHTDESWHNAGVMFIMENPSLDYGIYDDKTISVNGQDITKRPAKLWYWMDAKNFTNETYGFPNQFKQKLYGRLIASIIKTFKLKNAYLTNFVKCGMSSDNENFKNTDEYSSDCIRICYNNFLKKEIQLIKPNVIFAFGSRTYYSLYDLVKMDSEFKNLQFDIIYLPHPARQSTPNDFFKTLYFCTIARGLKKRNIIDTDEYKDLMINFADDF